MRNEAPGFTLRVPTAPGLHCAPKRRRITLPAHGTSFKKAAMPRWSEGKVRSCCPLALMASSEPPKVAPSQMSLLWIPAVGRFRTSTRSGRQGSINLASSKLLKVLPRRTPTSIHAPKLLPKLLAAPPCLFEAAQGLSACRRRLESGCVSDSMGHSKSK